MTFVPGKALFQDFMVCRFVLERGGPPCDLHEHPVSHMMVLPRGEYLLLDSLDPAAKAERVSVEDHYEIREIVARNWHYAQLVGGAETAGVTCIFARQTRIGHVANPMVLCNVDAFEEAVRGWNTANGR